MCQLVAVSRRGFYRSLRQREPAEEETEVRSLIQQICQTDGEGTNVFDIVFSIFRFLPAHWGRRKITVEIKFGAVTLGVHRWLRLRGRLAVGAQ
jgi:hypothetical protein